VLGAQSTKAVHRRLVGVAITALLLLGGAVSGCAFEANAGCPGVAVLRVTERDFKISAPKQVHAGKVEVLARNRGPDDHELIIVREDGAPLPFRSDGITIDEDALELLQAGALEPFGGSTVGTLHLDLTPGRYVLFCNMAGHYLGGMHTTLVVR
jgi:uncharacterized cupredoxin-like copper-binding protein